MGIDSVYTANNHNCDAGIHGVKETINQLERYEIGNTGTFNSAEDNRTLIYNVNGIKVGFVSYCTLLYNGNDKIWDPEDVETYLNKYDKEKASKDVQLLRDQGAEYIIVFIHWGTKNCFGCTDSQLEVAQELADLGVDYIAGSHPHVLQEYDVLTSADGRSVLCLYSLGDFNSCLNQIPGNRDTIILRLELERNEEGKVQLKGDSYIPCYTYTTYKDASYVTVPLNTELTKEEKSNKYDTFRKRIKKVLGNGIKEYVVE